jgi:hypothetical protein
LTRLQAGPVVLKLCEPIATQCTHKDPSSRPSRHSVTSIDSRTRFRDQNTYIPLFHNKASRTTPTNRCSISDRGKKYIFSTGSRVALGFIQSPMGTEDCFSGGKATRGENDHLHAAPTLRKGGAMPPLIGRAILRWLVAGFPV